MATDLSFGFGISLGFKGLKEIMKAVDTTEKLSKAFNLNDKYTNKLAKSFENLQLKQENLADLGKKFSSLKTEATGAIASGLAITVPVKFSADIEDSMNSINSFLNIGKAELNEYKNSLLDISSSFGAPIKEVSNLAQMGAKLGIKSKLGLKEFSELGLKYQKVYKLSNEETSNFLSKLSNIYNLNTTQMNELGSSMLEVSKIANVSASSVAKIMNEVGGDAKMLGLDAKSTSALSAILASATKDENEAVRTFKAMTGIMSGLNNASDDMKAKFLSLGLSTEQLSAYFKQDTNGAVKVLLNQIKTLPKDKMSDFLNSVFETAAAGMMRNLVDNTDKYEKALKSLKNTKMGALNNEFKKLGDSTNTSFAKLSASIDAFPNLSKAIGTLVVSLTIASAALSALKVGFLVAKIAGAQFAFTLNAIRIAFNILKVAFLTNPIGLVLMAIVTIATLIIMNWDKVKAFFMNFIEKISSIFSAFGDFFKGVWQGVGEFFSSLWGGLFEWFASKFEYLSNAFSKVKDIVKSVASFLVLVIMIKKLMTKKNKFTK